MNFKREIALLFLLSIPAGCATLPTGPSVHVMPADGKPFEQFQREDATCRQWAETEIGMRPSQNPTGSPETASSPVYGAEGKRRYDTTYVQCMASYGNQMPAYHQPVAMKRRHRRTAPPPPPVEVAPLLPPDFSANMPPEDVVIPPPDTLPKAGQYRLPEDVYVDTAPLFIYSSTLGLSVAVGIPYDLLYNGVDYFYFYGGRWYVGPFYDGPWTLATRKYFPKALLRFGIASIRHYRDVEFRLYEKDRSHYSGKVIRPDFRGVTPK